MTLTKTPPKRPSTASRKRTGQHHKKGHHYAQAYWPYLPIIAILVFGFFANSWLSKVHRSVLGYATDMSAQALLDGTNSQRAANGEAGLTMNGLLTQAAQNKANDMAARNYWSHNTPDGQTPWTFISATGYSYQRAGENLAYGFATSADTITAWMNSSEHRANILNTYYQEVGFGIVNIPDYQNSGPQTLVVAMYAQPAAVVAATPAPITTTPKKPAPTPAPVPAPTEAAPVPEPTPTPVPTVASTKRADTVVAAQRRDGINEQRVARIQLFTNGNASWSLLAVTLLATCGLLIFLFKHALAWHKFLVRGERFVLHHPMLDVAFVAIATIGLILAQTSGLIR